jgi:adenosine deaminase
MTENTGTRGARQLANEDARQLRELIARLPKVELHQHLPGSLRTQTVIDLADEYGFDLPSRDPEVLRPYLQVMPDTPAELGPILRTLGDFQRRCFVSPEALSRLTFEMIEDAYREGIVYLEIRFSPLTMAGDSLTYDQVMDGIADGIARGRAQYDIETRVLLGMTRTNLSASEGIAELALALAEEEQIAGVDLSGDEAVAPARDFETLFARIRSESELGITIHAGEAAGPQSVRDAVERLGADRIGHGVRAIQDPEVVALLQQQGTVVETCPTSNVLTGAVPSLAEHPLPLFLEKGVAATINTDDPAWFDSTLNQEYYRVLVEMGLSFAQLRQAVLNAAEGAFLPAGEKSKLRQRLDAAYTDVAPEFEAILQQEGKVA